MGWERRTGSPLEVRITAVTPIGRGKKPWYATPRPASKRSELERSTLLMMSRGSKSRRVNVLDKKHTRAAIVQNLWRTEEKMWEKGRDSHKDEQNMELCFSHQRPGCKSTKAFTPKEDRRLSDTLYAAPDYRCAP